MASEKSLNNFAHTIRASVDHASQEVNNNGQLWKNFNGDLDHVKFPAPINALLPEGVDLRNESLIITARDWHGRGHDQLAFWLETASQPGWEMPAITRNYYGEDEPAHASIGNKPSDENAFSRYVISYMSLMEDIPAYIATHGMAMAFRRGINYIAESGIASSSIVKRTGHKTMPNGYAMNGFQLEASVTDEMGQEGDVATTIETRLNYFFEPSVEAMPYGGCLLRAVSITLQNNEITASERKSSISFMDNPFVDGDQVSAYSDGSASEESALPQQLREQLYPDNVVSDEDIAYFINLATTPLTEEDVIIL